MRKRERERDWMDGKRGRIGCGEKEGERNFVARGRRNVHHDFHNQFRASQIPLFLSPPSLGLDLHITCITCNDDEKGRRRERGREKEKEKE